MTRAEMKDVAESAIAEMKFVVVTLKVSDAEFCLFPLLSGDSLLLGMDEYNFDFDGYSVFAYSDIKTLRPESERRNAILRAERLAERAVIPAVKLKDWRTALKSISELYPQFIIEGTYDDTGEEFFLAGSVEDLSLDELYFKNFDADGVWESEPYQLYYSEIFRVNFGSRYVEVLSRHLTDGK